jgi:hypothetical protein
MLVFPGQAEGKLPENMAAAQACCVFFFLLTLPDILEVRIGCASHRKIEGVMDHKHSQEIMPQPKFSSCLAEAGQCIQVPLLPSSVFSPS